MALSWRPARERGDWELLESGGTVVGRVRQVRQRGGTVRWQGSTTSGYRLQEELDSLAQAKLAVEVMAEWAPPIGDQRRPRPGRRRYVPNTGPDPAPHPGTLRQPLRPSRGTPLGYGTAHPMTDDEAAQRFDEFLTGDRDR